MKKQKKCSGNTRIIKTPISLIIRGIVYCCSNRSIKSVQNISDELQCDRIAIGKYVNLLSDIGVLIPHYQGKRVFYTLNPDIQRYIENESNKDLLEFEEE